MNHEPFLSLVADTFLQLLYPLLSEVQAVGLEFASQVGCNTYSMSWMTKFVYILTPATVTIRIIAGLLLDSLVMVISHVYIRGGCPN